MKSTHWLGLSITAFVALVEPSGAASEPTPSATSSASAAPAVSASANAKPPPPPHVRGEDIPAERSPLPKAAEWAQAKEVSIDDLTFCKARVLREWLSIECTDHFGGGLVAGDPKDVHVTADGEALVWDDAAHDMKHTHVTAILPIERGKARIVSFLDFNGGGGDYGPSMAGEGAAVHVWWREGEASPRIVATFGR